MQNTITSNHSPCPSPKHQSTMAPPCRLHITSHHNTFPFCRLPNNIYKHLIKLRSSTPPFLPKSFQNPYLTSQRNLASDTPSRKPTNHPASPRTHGPRRVRIVSYPVEIIIWAISGFLDQEVRYSEYWRASRSVSWDR